jgi:hypothetical protein
MRKYDENDTVRVRQLPTAIGQDNTLRIDRSLADEFEVTLDKDGFPVPGWDKKVEDGDDE